MRKRYALAGIGAVALALLILNIAAPITTTPDGTIGVKLVIEVHRNGTTEKYVKEGDLILLNFAKIIVQLVQAQDPDGDNKPVSPSGSAVEPADIYESGMGMICLGTGTTPPSVDDYKLNNEVACFNVQDADITINGTDITIDIFGSYTVQQNLNITEIGLRTTPLAGTNNNDYKFYIFRDVLQNPISLNAGDGITVHYYIFLDNP